MLRVAGSVTIFSGDVRAVVSCVHRPPPQNEAVVNKAFECSYYFEHFIQSVPCSRGHGASGSGTVAS